MDELLDIIERSPSVASFFKTAVKTGVKVGRKAGRVAKKVM